MSSNILGHLGRFFVISFAEKGIVDRSFENTLTHSFSEQGTVRVRFLHSSLHILCFDICIDWQEKTNDKTQLSASFPWGVQNQKKTRKPKKTKQKKKENHKKTKKKKQENQEDLLGLSACDIGLDFVFCFLFFCLFVFFGVFLIFFVFFGFGNL